MSKRYITMPLSLTSQDYETIWDAATSNGDITYQETEFESYYDYPPFLGQGQRRSYQLRPGLSLSIDDHTNRDYLIRKIPEQQWLVWLFFYIAENYRCDCGA
jgi:hypothetical protein